MADTMEQRRLGSSDVMVSHIGLGTAPLGGLYRPVADDEAIAVVLHALERGVTFIDTAPLYGHGTAERRIGAALAGVDRSSFVVSTKVGRLIVDDPDGDTGPFADARPSSARFDFSRDGVRRSLEQSLERLGLDRVDIVLIHDPDDHERQALDEAYPALHELRAAGVVGAIGVGMNQTMMPARFARETEVDVILLAGRYTLLDQSAGADLLPTCLERGVSVVIGGVFNSGVLADPSEGAMYDYHRASPEVVERARRLQQICQDHDVDLPAAALAFPFRHEAVACVLTGVRDRHELDCNLAYAAEPVPGDLWADLTEQGLLEWGS